MAWGADQVPLEDAFRKLNLTAARIKSIVQKLRDRSAVGAISRAEVVDLKRLLNNAESEWLTAVSGVNPAALRDYIRQQKNNPSFDPQAEYIAMRNGAAAFRQWIHDNLPTDSGTGAILERVSNEDGSFSPLSVPSANALAVAFRAQADTFIALL